MVWPGHFAVNPPSPIHLFRTRFFRPPPDVDRFTLRHRRIGATPALKPALMRSESARRFPRRLTATGGLSITKKRTVPSAEK